MSIIAFLLILALVLCGFEADLPLFGLHGFLSIAFPYILLVSFVYFLLGCFFKRKIAIIMLLGSVIVFSKIKKIVALSFGTKSEITQKTKTVTIMSWNVRRFIAPLEENIDNPLDLKYFSEIIKKHNPDILCLLDYAEKTKISSRSISIQRIKKELGFSYHFFHLISTGYNNCFKFGNVILSKYPISKTGEKVFEDYFIKKSGIAFIQCSIHNTPVRIYTSHFQSYGLSEDDFKHLQKIKYEQEVNKEETRSLYSKMSKSFAIRGKQVVEAIQYINQSSLPKVLCTDLNDVPNSFCYNMLNEHFKDAFLQVGFNGVGRTYLRLLPTLRIDYIFADPSFAVHHFKVIKKEVSDHYPIVAKLSF